MDGWNSRRIGIYLALGAGILIIGFSAIFVRLANAPGTVASFYRMAIAVVVMALPFAQRVKNRGQPFSWKGMGAALLGGIFFGLDLAFWSTGIVISGATNPTLLANTAPVWVGLGSWLIFKERQKSKFWLGLTLAMAGAMIVLSKDLTRALDFGVGTFYGLLAAIFYGAYYLVTQRGRASLDTLTYFWITTLSSAIMLLALSLVIGQPLLGYSNLTYLNFLALGLVVQVLGWMAITFVQGYLPASIVAPTLLAQPVVTAILAASLLGESLGFIQISGGIVVIIGVYIVHRSR